MQAFEKMRDTLTFVELITQTKGNMFPGEEVMIKNTGTGLKKMFILNLELWEVWSFLCF